MKSMTIFGQGRETQQACTMHLLVEQVWTLCKTRERVVLHGFKYTFWPVTAPEMFAH